MVTEGNFVFVTILFAMHWMNSCTSQRLDYGSATCSGPDEINTLKGQTSVLQQLVNTQAIKIEVLEKELNSVNKTLSKLDQANEKEMVEEELNSVKKTLFKLDQANKTEMLEEELNLIKEAMSKLCQANKTKKIEKELNSSKEALSILSKSTFPAFLAHTTSDTSRTPVVYDVAHGGYHHGYSTSTGEFTADRDGLYLFLYNTEALNEVVRTALRVNGVEIIETRSDGGRSGYDDTSAVTVLHLSSNDRVSVGVKSGTVDDGQSLFFGILLFEI